MKILLSRILLIATTLTTLAGCLESEESSLIQPVFSVGMSCDVTDFTSCGGELGCEAIIEGGDLVDAVCLYRQGHTCNPNAPEMCGRAQECRPSFDDPDTFRCLPNSCVDDTECPGDQYCRNSFCNVPLGCSPN